MVDAELQRLRWLWQCDSKGQVSARSPNEVIELEALIGEEAYQELDLFDRLQLESVIRVCRESKSLSDAGRKLFDHSRTQRSVVNDADRLRKYLHNHDLSWSDVSASDP